MKKFKIGDRVIVIEDNEVKRGTIKNIYPELCTIIVEFDDGNVGKVSELFIAHEPKTETKAETTVESEVEEKHEDAPRMRSEITITPDEFREVAVKVISDHTINGEGTFSENMLFGMKAVIVFGEICAILFSDKESENSDNVE